MDSNDQERERGITILAKCTSVLWHGAAGETRINIIDTPGHADFGGEVERILGMVDGCVLLVDAEEGVMPQTKFVLGKALKIGLKPILVLNKVDRPHAEPDKVLNDAFDLFAALGATDAQLDFPHLYASAKQGWAVKDLADPRETLAPLFDLIVDPRRPASGGGARRRAGGHAGGAGRGRPLPGPPADRPHRRRAAGARHERACPVAGRPRDRARADQQDPGVSRPEADRHRGGVRRRHRRHRRALEGHRRRHRLRARGGRRPAGAADRSADHRHHRLGQHQPARRPRRRQGAKPGHPRAADARGRGERRHPLLGDSGEGRLRDRRPRRAAAGRLDRDHAARRLRALDQPPARGLSDGRRSASGWSRSRRS